MCGFEFKRMIIYNISFYFSSFSSFHLNYELPMSSIAYLENSLHSWEKEGFGEFLFMLGRLGFLLAASVAAYAVKRPKAKTSRLKPSPPSNSGLQGSNPVLLDTENGAASTAAEVEAARKDQQDEDSSTRIKVEKEEEEEEEEEEVKTISSFINATVPRNAAAPDLLDDDEEGLLPEIESLLSGEGEMDVDINDPLPEKKYDADVEMERLRRLVKELEEREAKLEGELLVYYGLEEEFKDLQKQLMTKTEEVEMLNITARSLQEEVLAATKELEVLRTKNDELQRQIQLDLGLDAAGGGGGGAPAWITPW